MFLPYISSSVGPRFIYTDSHAPQRHLHLNKNYGYMLANQLCLVLE